MDLAAALACAAWLGTVPARLHLAVARARCRCPLQWRPPQRRCCGGAHGGVLVGAAPPRAPLRCPRGPCCRARSYACGSVLPPCRCTLLSRVRVAAALCSGGRPSARVLRLRP
eukprot:15453616-Alexandrium_andersonii.AAC.1